MGILHPVILRSLHLQPEGEGMEEEEEEGNVSHPKAEEVLWYDHMKHFHKIDTYTHIHDIHLIYFWPFHFTSLNSVTLSVWFCMFYIMPHSLCITLDSLKAFYLI